MIIDLISIFGSIVHAITQSFNTKFHTSEIDFCETNNDTFIVEQFNTWSSLIISLYGLYGIMKICRYHKTDRDFWKEIFVFFNLFVVGLCSVYFHSTLSAFGHLLDIYSIACILSSAIFIIDHSSKMSLGFSLLVSAIICVLAPSFELLVLFTKGFYVRTRVDKVIESYENSSINEKIFKYIKSKYITAQYMFIIAFIFWLIDFFLCRYLNGMHFHFIFHVLIGHVAYVAIDTISTLRRLDQDMV